MLLHSLYSGGYMLIYGKLLLQNLSRLSEVLCLLVANMTSASCPLSGFLLHASARNPFLGTSPWDGDLSPHGPALPALKQAHVLPVSLDTC